LVEAVMPFLDEWQALLKDVQRFTPERVTMMLDRAEELRDQADRAGQGAIVHQLEVCIACLRAPALDRRGVLEALRSLSEASWQLKQEVAPRAASPDAAPHSLPPPPLLSGQSGPPLARGGVEPPPPLSLPGAPRGSAPPDLAASRVGLPPSMDHSRAGGGAPAHPPAASRLGGLVNPRNAPPKAPPAPPARATEPPLVEPVARPDQRPPDEVDALFQRAAPARGGSPRPAAPPILSLGNKSPGGGGAPAPRTKDKPNLMVATMFGLRAFGRNNKGPAPAQRGPSAPPQPQRPSHGAQHHGAQRGAGVLGLGQRSNPSDQPAWIGARAGGLPELPKGGYRNAAERAAAELEDSLHPGRPSDDPRGDRRSKPPTIPPGERRSKPSTYPPGADRVRSGSRGERDRGDRDRGERSDRFVRVDRGREGSLPIPWWIGGVAVAVVGLVVVGLLVVGRASSTARDAAAETTEASGDDTPLPTSKLLDEKERMRALISSVHDFGGGESPELADLVNEEAALVNEVLQKSCDQPGDKCERAVPMIAGTALSTTTPQNKMHQLFEDRKITSSGRGTGKVPQWLAGLRVPAIGVGDNPMVRQKVQYFTENQAGREEFQNLLFRCGAYRDLIERTLVDAGLPKTLLALVMTESGCNAHAESPVGARGLWQFMPATGRAYHLHIKENVVDERVSPRKSSAAAVRYLADLRRKMGSWEFAMASYNMGPFGLASRIKRAGGEVTFWDLADNGFLPDETARYVPRIQAYALILENLARFNFSAAQMRATEMTDELQVPGGTRLSLIARAASTSFDHLKLLNPDIVGAAVPELGNEIFMVQVPRDDAGRARSVLESLLTAGNEEDRCVSSGFDWGSERFSDEMCGGEVRPRRRPRR
jgi:hypothetical protein